MDHSEQCKVTDGCKMHWCGIFGMILIVLAAILTIFTLSGLGILGMFLVGIMLCCHKHLSSSHSCASMCRCKCCSTVDHEVCTTLDAEKTGVHAQKKPII